MNESVRKVFAFTGCALWMLSSFCPLFGAGAKVEAKCHGDFECTWETAGDYLPILELLAPFAAFALLAFFAKLAFACWAPEPDRRRHRWRFAPVDGTTVYHPGYMGLALIGAAWALWRAALYPLDPVTLPYLFFWIVFASWFAASAWMAGPARGSEAEA